MCIVAMYNTTCTRLICTDILVMLGLITLLLVVGVRLVPLGFTMTVTLTTMVTLVIFSLILFLQILGIGSTLLFKHLTLRGQWLLGIRMHGRL